MFNVLSLLSINITINERVGAQASANNRQAPRTNLNLNSA